MTEETETGPAQVSRPLTALEIFFIKLGGVTASVIVILVCSTLFLQLMIESKIEQTPFLKGGPAFWKNLETNVDTFADSNDDIPPEQKAKIIASLKKIADRYRPYFEAATGSPPHN